MLLASDGSDPRLLPPLTAGDEQPAFLPSGRALVFSGRATARATPDLYSVATSGRGLRRLTTGGGTDPAPCANGSIAYIRGSGEHARLYLRIGGRSVSHRLSTLEASAPSCAPDSRTIAFIHQGELFVVSSTGRRLQLVTRASGYGPRDEPDSGSGAFADTFSPDGNQIAMLVDYNVDSANGSEEALASVNLRGRTTAPKLVIGDSSFSGDSGQADDDTSTGVSWQPLRSPDPSLSLIHGSPYSTGDASPVTDAAFGPGAHRLTTVSAGGGVSLFSVSSVNGTQRLKRLIGLPAARAGAMALSPNGRFIAVAATAGQIWLYSLDPGGIGAEVSGSGFTAAPGVTALAFSADGGALAAESSDVTYSRGLIKSPSPQHVTVAFLDPGTGALRRAPAAPVSTGSASGIDDTPPRCGGLAFRGYDGELAASATLTNADPNSGVDGAIQLFSTDEATGSLTPGASAGLTSAPSADLFIPCPEQLAYSGSGELLGDAYGFGEIGGALNVWSLGVEQTATALLVGTPFLPTASWTLGATAISRDGRLLAVAISSQTADSGPAGGNGEIALAALDPEAAPVAAGPFSTGQRSVIDTLAISPMDGLLATGNHNGTVSLFALRRAAG